MQKFLTFLILITLCSYPLQWIPKATAWQSEELPVKEKVQPERIFISSLRLDLPVQMSPIINSEWVLTDEKTTFYGQGTATPGDSGTTVIFAHARNGLFSGLARLEKGNTIVVKGKSSFFVYKVNSSLIVGPEDVSFIKTNGDNTLALFTCYGFNDKQRIVYLSDFIGEVKINTNSMPIHEI